MINYILDRVSRKTIPCADIRLWSEYFAESTRNNTRHVGDDERNGVRVSTVFLGVDHNFNEGPPILFETMIFGGEMDGEQDRYSTYEEAEAGHQLWCQRVFLKEST